MEYVSIEVHNEFAARMKEENDRQNHRISSLEDGQKQINELISSVKVLAVNMENMAKEQAKQGERLEAIEQKPAKHWDTVIACLITGIVGAVLTAAISGIFH
ncbi:MAG: hypothetical protein IJ608_05695 [Lachnospiraceae bacterium]|nr:hypothetical protein [Lachnospiraceae bacterium]